MEDYTVVMAIGAVWKPNSTSSIDTLLTESEQLMYEDKAEYYRTHGIDRRR